MRKPTEGADAGRVTVNQGSSGTPERRMDRGDRGNGERNCQEWAQKMTIT